MSFERKLEVTINNQEITLSLHFIDTGEVGVKVTAPPHRATGRWNIDVRNKQLQFTTVMTDGPNAVCILHCLGIAIGKALLECLLGSGSLKEVEGCLKGKAIGALSDSVVCIAQCLGIA